MADSKRILDRIRKSIPSNQSNILYETIIQCLDNDLIDFEHQVKLFDRLGNEYLKVKTKQAYNRAHVRSRMYHNFAKGEWIRFPDVDLVTDL